MRTNNKGIKCLYGKSNCYKFAIEASSPHIPKEYVWWWTKWAKQCLTAFHVAAQHLNAGYIRTSILVKFKPYYIMYMLKILLAYNSEFSQCRHTCTTNNKQNITEHFQKLLKTTPPPPIPRPQPTAGLSLPRIVLILTSVTIDYFPLRSTWLYLWWYGSFCLVSCCEVHLCCCPWQEFVYSFCLSRPSHLGILPGYEAAMSQGIRHT